MARFRGEDGANAVEFALIFPLLIVLVFGVIYGGFAFNTKLTLTQAAREGARFGATLPVSAFDGAGGLNAWAEAVEARVEDSAFGDRGLSITGDRYICVRFVEGDTELGNITRENGSGDCTVDASAINSDGPRVEVVVSRPSRLDLIFYSFDVELRSVGIARYETSPSEGG